MYFELESNKVLMFILGGGIFTVVCWVTYQYYVIGNSEILNLVPTINNNTHRWPYEGWESFSENDDWVQIEKLV